MNYFHLITLTTAAVCVYLFIYLSVAVVLWYLITKDFSLILGSHMYQGRISLHFLCAEIRIMVTQFREQKWQLMYPSMYLKGPAQSEWWCGSCWTTWGCCGLCHVSQVLLEQNMHFWHYCNKTHFFCYVSDHCMRLYPSMRFLCSTLSLRQIHFSYWKQITY